MEILSAEQMRRIDRRTIDELGVASLLLMESAGRAVADALAEDEPDLGLRPIVVLCGPGNNGGDGLVVARWLRRRGHRPTVVLACAADRLRGDAAINLRAARASGVEILAAPDQAAWAAVRDRLDGRPIVVDALLGTGARGGVREPIASVIADLGTRDATVVAVDIPSGVDADSADAPAVCVAADRTYALCRLKPALVLDPAAGCAGRVRVLPIGIPQAAVDAEDADLFWLDADAAAALCPARAADSHKGTYGHLLLVAGARDRAGAAVLAAGGALRAGAGLVTAALPASARVVVLSARPEAMAASLPETADGELAAEGATRVLELAAGCAALAVGPGLGHGPATAAAVLSILAADGPPVVVDADGLNVLAEASVWPARRAGGVVLTPHPGEAARLLRTSAAAVQRDRLGAARRLAEAAGAVVVLKGHRTIVAEPGGHRAVNSSGNPGLATAGSGDVLTGVIGALLARGLPAWDAARLGAFVHGAAGDRAAARLGQDGLVAGDVVEALPSALRALVRSRGEGRTW